MPTDLALRAMSFTAETRTTDEIGVVYLNDGHTQELGLRLSIQRR